MKTSRFLGLSLAVGLILSFGASSSWASGASVFSDGYYNIQSLPGALADNTLKIVNPGSSNSSLCADIYVFNANQEMLSCCSCYVSKNGSLTLSVIKNLLVGSTTVNTGVIEVVSSNTPCSAETAAPALSLTVGSRTGSEVRPLSSSSLNQRT